MPPRISDFVTNEQRDQMPRYYFHIRNADDMARDEEGTDLPDLDSAYKAALVCARELMAIGVKEGADRMPESILIRMPPGGRWRRWTSGMSCGAIGKSRAVYLSTGTGRPDSAAVPPCPACSAFHFT